MAQRRLIAAPCGTEGQLTWAQFNGQLSQLEPAGWMDLAEMCSSPGKCHWQPGPSCLSLFPSLLPLHLMLFVNTPCSAPSLLHTGRLPLLSHPTSPLSVSGTLWDPGNGLSCPTSLPPLRRLSGSLPFSHPTEVCCSGVVPVGGVAGDRAGLFLGIAPARGKHRSSQCSHTLPFLSASLLHPSLFHPAQPQQGSQQAGGQQPDKR